MSFNAFVNIIMRLGRWLLITMMKYQPSTNNEFCVRIGFLIEKQFLNHRSTLIGTSLQILIKILFGPLSVFHLYLQCPFFILQIQLTA